MVFYRKYRPQKIDDLDSTDVRETLESVLSKVNLSHAFLFTGPKGLGKTSSARIVAKAVNCITAQTKRKNGFEPCDKCENCISIANSTNMDILEIDAASNRGIDEIRDLKEKIRLTPLSSKMKVYIIDEVHMLTAEAFNALLKTLEEPPQHAMFILCTTEAQKVPATILSRCFHIAFKKATEDELVRSFTRIAKDENLSVDKEALKFIASLSDGSFRDGAKIMEEMSLLAGKKPITKDLIEEKYKVLSLNKSAEEMIEFLTKEEVKAALNLVSELIEQGIDIKYFTQVLIEILHKELLMQVQTDEKGLELDIITIKHLVEVFAKAYTEMKYAVLPQLPLEMAIIEYSMPESFAKQNAELRGDQIQRQSASGSKTISDMRRQEGNIKKIKAMYGSDKKTPKSDEKIANHSSITLMHTSNGEDSREWLEDFWKNIITEMKNYNHTIAGLLRGCRIGGYDKKLLIIETNYKFHKERLDDVKTMSELSRVAKLLTGKEVKVEVQLRRD